MEQLDLGLKEFRTFYLFNSSLVRTPVWLTEHFKDTKNHKALSSSSVRCTELTAVLGQVPGH